ncbi:hypothetical protein [Secundilactobacillus kimchicus]|uniref:hypothetical protein n=1 Tax=Secundilactobacillus kimchicus TaxID=528209 RepID=UPI0024A96D02|nr:hypothetical protein [Secundilactobacillus kimchicus]
MSTLLMGMSLMTVGASAEVTGVSDETENETALNTTETAGPDSNTAEIMETFNPQNMLRTTAYGNAGVSKVWVSGGAIWFSVKLYDYPVYNWNGQLHVTFTNGKVRNFPVGGMGVAGKTWTGHRSYKAYGQHGKATLSGYAVSVTGQKATVLHPYSSF